MRGSNLLTHIVLFSSRTTPLKLGFLPMRSFSFMSNPEKQQRLWRNELKDGYNKTYEDSKGSSERS